MKVVELFAGIGGFKLGIEAVFPQSEFVFISEWDKFAQISYQAIHGIKPNGDIVKVNENDIPEHDLLVGGFPCQAFSIIGNRKGFEDTRGTLFFDMVRIAKVKQPKVIIMENVKGLVGHDKGRTLDIMIESLNSIGYVCDFEIINSEVHEVPQNRERIFIVAIRKDLIKVEKWSQSLSPTISKGKNRIEDYGNVLSFNFDWSSIKKESHILEILEDEVDESFYLDDNNPLFDSKSGHYTIVAKRPKERFSRQSIEVMNTYLKTVTKGTMIQPFNKSCNKTGISPTITTRPDGLKTALLVVDESQKGNHLRLRKLTPKECWRLQGFSDKHYEQAVKAGVSNAQCYKQAGNAVTVNVIEFIMKKIKEMKLL